MKLALLADIHANFQALQAVAADIEIWRPDLVVVAGDLVNRGPRPLECLNLVREGQRTNGWLVTRGNHEDYIIAQAQPHAPRNGPAFDVHQGSWWTWRELDGNLLILQAMPFDLNLHGPDNSKICITHASMRSLRDGIYPHTSDDELEQLVGPPPALFLVGHTHIPLIRSLNGILVVNAGSAGLPFDGDTRPSYARLTWQHGAWKAEIVRVPYDIAQAERDFFTTSFLNEAGPLVRLVLRELKLARAQLGGWVDRYQQRALAGDISMRQSVDEYLASR
jgi:putative phosphoesterase